MDVTVRQIGAPGDTAPGAPRRPQGSAERPSVQQVSNRHQECPAGGTINRGRRRGAGRGGGGGGRRGGGRRRSARRRSGGSRGGGRRGGRSRGGGRAWVLQRRHAQLPPVDEQRLR